MEPLAFFDGKLAPQSLAKLMLHDAGFVLGATVTDLCRTFQQQLYRWDDHLARFRASCAAASVPVPLEDDRITAAARQVVEHNARLAGNGELALVLFATPGPIGYYLGEPGGAGEGMPTFGMHTFPLPRARYRRLFAEGAYLAVPSVRQVSSAAVDPRIKHRSRLHWWLAEQELKQSHPGALALLLNEDDGVTETAFANFLIVKEGVIVSPPAPSVLPGVSLKVLMELSAELGLRWEERALRLEDCQTADEALLSGTAFCVAGVSRLHDHKLPWPGPVFEKLLSAWSAQVGLDIRQQMLS